MVANHVAVDSSFVAVTFWFDHHCDEFADFVSFWVVDFVFFLEFSYFPYFLLGEELVLIEGGEYPAYSLEGERFS